MSPEMLTLVAAVLAYDLVESARVRREFLDWRSSRSLSRNEISWTNDEKDIMNGVEMPINVEKWIQWLIDSKCL